MGVGVAQDQVPVLAAVEDDLPEETQGGLREVHHEAHDLVEAVALVGVQPLAHPAGDRVYGPHRPAAEDLRRLVAPLAALDHLPADLETELADDADQVALRRVAPRAHHEVRRGEGVEVRGVVGDVEYLVLQLAQQARGRGQGDAVDGVGGLRRRHHVGLGADPADACGDTGHLLHRPPLAELLEAAQLRHLEEAVADLAVLVQEDVHLPVPLEAGDGVDRDVSSRHGPHPLPSARPPFRWLEDRLKR